MDALRHGDLQRHINRRSPSAAAITIKKELDTLRSAWNWAKRMGHVKEDFPGPGLVYPKGEEKLPCMTWKEVERRIVAGGDPEDLWECLYLRENEIEHFLDFVEKRKAPVWLYPLCVMAAHTGARRSEMLRACGADGPACLQPEQVRERKPSQSQGADPEEIPAGKTITHTASNRLAEEGQHEVYYLPTTVGGWGMGCPHGTRGRWWETPSAQEDKPDWLAQEDQQGGYRK
jgi:hypothetical protein